MMTNASPTQIDNNCPRQMAGNRIVSRSVQCCVGLLRNLGKVLHSAGYAGLINLHKGESLAGRVEGVMGFGGESRRDAAFAGNDGISLGYCSSSVCSLAQSVVVCSLSFGSRSGTRDLGAAGSVLASLALSVGSGRSSVGRRRFAGRRRRPHHGELEPRSVRVSVVIPRTTSAVDRPRLS